MKTVLLGVTATLSIIGCASHPTHAKFITPIAAHQSSVPYKPPPPSLKAEFRAVAAVNMDFDPSTDLNDMLAKRSIYYEFDASQVNDQYESLLKAHAAYLTAHKSARVSIEGNSDERGSREYNLALGERRASGVKAALEILGVSDDQMSTVSWGEERPKALGQDEQAWSENRRSDIVYSKAGP